MNQPATDSSPRWSESARFWEPRRLWYDGALVTVVLLWVVFTWPHFRPAFTLEAFGKMLVLALLANLCYSAAYPVDWLIQSVSWDTARRRFRRSVWIAGTLLALLIENYWIATKFFPTSRANRALECRIRRDVSRRRGLGKQYELSRTFGGDGIPGSVTWSVCRACGGADFLVRA